MRTGTRVRFENLPEGYAALCREAFLPRPLLDGVDYASVEDVTDAMALWQDEFTPDQREYFDTLCRLMEDYDKDHVSWPALTPLDRLRHLLEENNLTAADLSRLLNGSRNLGGMILRGDRNLTVDHVRKLAAHFKVSPELFI
jgi:HTH-type transcriptional regulator/antitoxin HigA